jgi:archaea-specific DNA-binding protein
VIKRGVKMDKENENVVFIGKKNIMSYVLAVVTQFNSGIKEVVVKARGKVISRAVDVTEIVRNRFVSDAEVKDVKIMTEEITGEDGNKNKVSAIEIILIRK